MLAAAATAACSLILAAEPAASFVPSDNISPFLVGTSGTASTSSTSSRSQHLLTSSTPLSAAATSTEPAGAKKYQHPAKTSTIARRAAEVASVAVLDVALPLIASAAKFSSSSTPQGWDAFWSSSAAAGAAIDGGVATSTKGTAATNAQRVAAALENLGPTYVKFGQALSSRPDIIPPSLAAALSKLQDDMEPFDTDLAKDIVRTELLGTNSRKRGERWGHENVGINGALHREEFGDGDKNNGRKDTRSTTAASDAHIDEETVHALVDSLSARPIAAASVGQVYKGHLPGYGPVAVKVRRPGVEDTVESDYALLRTVALLIESIPALPSTSKAVLSSSSSASASASASTSASQVPKQDRLIATELVAAIDEFMGRLIEELDYNREERNARRFASLYAVGTGSAVDTMPDVNGKGVVVPEFLPGLCTDNVIVMSWIEGTKLTDVSEKAALTREDKQSVKENLELIELATQCTLSQLLDTGVLHADPHGGNLLKVEVPGSDPPRYRLAYLDFGIVSYVPSQVRDGLVCAVASLVFAGDTAAVADLFGELQLIPEDVLNDPSERAALQAAMKQTLQESLKYPDVNDDGETAVPVLLFDKLLDALSRLVPRFRFDLPPYFINNARALSTLEGIARTLDPSFNVLSVMYPTALNRMFQNPTKSPVVDETLQSLIRSKDTGRIDRKKVSDLLRDSALISGHSKRKVISDVLKTRGGRKLIRGAIREELDERVVKAVFRRRKGTRSMMPRERGKRRSLSRYFKL